MADEERNSERKGRGSGLRMRGEWLGVRGLDMKLTVILCTIQFFNYIRLAVL